MGGGVETWAALAAFAAALGLGVRRVMLRPTVETWAASPAPVRWALNLSAFVMGAVGVSILAGAGASQREAVAYTALALLSWVQVVNLHFDRHQQAEPRG